MCKCLFFPNEFHNVYFDAKKLLSKGDDVVLGEMKMMRIVIGSFDRKVWTDAFQ